MTECKKIYGISTTFFLLGIKHEGIKYAPSLGAAAEGGVLEGGELFGAPPGRRLRGLGRWQGLPRLEIHLRVIFFIIYIILPLINFSPDVFGDLLKELLLPD